MTEPVAGTRSGPVVGIGVSSQATPADVTALVDRVLAEAGIEPSAVAAIATVDSRLAHPALAALPWPVVGVPRTTLESPPIATAASPRLEVAVPAALHVAGPGATLLVGKTVGRASTAAIAISPTGSEQGASVWPRPTPTVGDPTSAAERSAAPQAWAFPPAARDALADVIAARRDVRSFRPDAVADDVLHALFDAAHRAPSVGLSQPWRFVVVREHATRDRAALLAERERLRQAELLAPERRRQLLDLKLDGIRDAPVGIVVACDRRTDPEGVLGRATFVDADMWSTACAIQNLWLTARGLGLGVGWVTLFAPDELGALVQLPAGIDTLGWLCVGWPDERLDVPGLERHGWSQRRPLDELVLAEHWPAGPDETSAPAAPTGHLAAPVPAAVVGARDAADRLLTPPGSLGGLDRALDRLGAAGRVGRSGARPRGVLVLVGADHPVAELGVSAFPASVTRDVLEATVAGCSLGAATARACGLEVVAVDAGVAGLPVPGAIDRRVVGPRGDLVAEDAMTADATRALIDAGADLVAADLRDADVITLGEVGIGNTTVAAALASALLAARVDGLVGRGTAADHAMVERKATVVRAALDRVLGPDAVGFPDVVPRDAYALLAALGGPEIALLTGVVLGAARAHAVVVLDGLATSLAALVAIRIEPAAAGYLVAGQRSREPAHAPVLVELGLEPLLDLRIRAGEGVGGALGAQLLLAAWEARSSTALVE